VGRGGGANLPMLFAICDANCDDTEFGRNFFMRKGVGWALRDAGRTHPGAVWDYVDSRRERLSGLSYREATRRLPPR
jgi:3-methyladenine DNA glycosylase AlkD